MTDARIEVTLENGNVEATLWLEGYPVEGHGDRTNTLSTWALVAPLLRRFESARHPAKVTPPEPPVGASGQSTGTVA